ncbi:hypothetical protein [Cellulomonas xiejunii]|uniref:Uncharacterized protein n=1 Tax=Cellulomonas xiejunii TaxID=2968083 RepID=A0ABY5KS98_9CELL|nr:hypothetical protein [Cellulomonas xiejunii]MCC2322288.1 hypothetical protein [Cellulomonas xiejunii]UUI72341.1 hypothetical protein NP048_02400 [Cellulomonas xiejunii]
MAVTPEIQVALVGLGGAAVGGLLTVSWQAISTSMANRKEAKAARRAERKDLYVEALWGLRAIRREMRETYLAERAANERGEAFTPGDPVEWWKLERLVFEVGVLGNKEVFDALTAAAETYREWVMSLDAESGLITFSVIEPKMAALEPSLRAAIRRDLDVG